MPFNFFPLFQQALPFSVGACDFEIYKNKKTNISVVEPSKNSRGDIARIYVKQAVLTNIKDRSLCLILN
jgi:hypothetical protein